MIKFKNKFFATANGEAMALKGNKRLIALIHDNLKHTVKVRFNTTANFDSVVMW